MRSISPSLNIFCVLLLLLPVATWSKWRMPMPSVAHTRAWAKSAALATSIATIFSTSAHAFGPVNMDLKIDGYTQVDLCNGKKPIMPGQKAAEGLFPVCIEVEAEVINPEKRVLTDVSVYGFVKEDEAGNSVLPNNPDFKSDSGQYAMIKEVAPGSQKVKYQFVAAVSSDPKKGPIPKISFMKTKAVSFPGGEKFKPLGECEIDPRAEGCDGEEED